MERNRELDPARRPLRQGLAVALLLILTAQQGAASDGPLERASIAFRNKRYNEAARWLRKAPQTPYTVEFLATIYLLQDNLEAALELWNRIGKPRIREVRAEPSTLKIDPVLLDHAFAFAPASTLLLDDLRTSQARTAALGIFPTSRFQLEALPEDPGFDLTFTAAERNGLAALQLLRGIGYQAVHAEFYNLRGSATNVISLVRWDPDKRRLNAAVSGPLRNNPAWRYSLAADARDERWTLTRTNSDLDLRRTAVAASAGYIDGTWSWSVGGEVSHRDISQSASGYQLKQTATLSRALYRNPQRRFRSALSLTSDTARLWPANTFHRLQAGIEATWHPQSQGPDYTIHTSLRTGRIAGTAPLDELFILGLERDNDLPLRAHIGTRNGRKGSAPMGDRYITTSWEIDKTIYSNGLLTLQASPFFDTGRIASRTHPGLASGQWLYDVGVQAKIRVLGIGVSLVYGKDLRTGANTFYLLSAR